MFIVSCSLSILPKIVTTATSTPRYPPLFHEREMYADQPPKTGGAIKPKKKADKSSLTRNGLLRGLLDRSMSWEDVTQVDLCNPISLRPAFRALEAGEYVLRDHTREDCLRLGVYHSRISRADQGDYT